MVHVENGLNVQQVPHNGFAGRQPPTPAQLAEIPHSKPVAEVGDGLLDKGYHLFQRLPLPLFLDCQIHQQALAHGGTEGIHRANHSVRKRLPQLFHCHGSVLIGGTEGRGKP